MSQGSLLGEKSGRLLSVNVGLPKDVAWHGQTVHTAVWKRAGRRAASGAAAEYRR